MAIALRQPCEERRSLSLSLAISASASMRAAFSRSRSSSALMRAIISPSIGSGRGSILAGITGLRSIYRAGPVWASYLWRSLWHRRLGQERLLASKWAFGAVVLGYGCVNWGCAFRAIALCLASDLIMCSAWWILPGSESTPFDFSSRRSTQGFNTDCPD